MYLMRCSSLMPCTVRNGPSLGSSTHLNIAIYRSFGVVFFFASFFFGPVACAPGVGMSAVGFTRSARRIASSVGSGMWIVLPGFGMGFCGLLGWRFVLAGTFRRGCDRKRYYQWRNTHLGGRRGNKLSCVRHQDQLKIRSDKTLNETF